jgi:hypothetical protein
MPMTTDSARTQRTAWWLFGPPALLAALRAWQQWQAERVPLPAAWPLKALPPPQATALDLLLPVLVWLAVVALLAAVLWWLARRGQGRAVRAGLLGAWVLACLAGAAALLLGAHNLRNLQAQPPVQAQVLGSRAVPPSLRSTGGTELILRIEGQAQPQQAIISDPQAATWPPGQRLQVQWARGRIHGLYVTGWHLP